jgi:hypothetical protein
MSIAAGVLFVLLLGVLHVLARELDPTWRFVSEYQLGRVGVLMHLAFLALATSLAGSGVALWFRAWRVRGVVWTVPPRLLPWLVTDRWAPHALSAQAGSRSPLTVCGR